MFVADVKCLQATRQTVPNSRTGSAKASVSEAVVRMWHRTHVIRGRPPVPSLLLPSSLHLSFPPPVRIGSGVWNVLQFLEIVGKISIFRKPKTLSRFNKKLSYHREIAL